jgi:hypothetical protein
MNLDVDQCIDVQWVLSRHASEIKSLGLQKLRLAKAYNSNHCGLF